MREDSIRRFSSLRPHPDRGSRLGIQTKSAGSRSQLEVDSGKKHEPQLRGADHNGSVEEIVHARGAESPLR